jgi:hypothetical protein
MLSFMCSTVAGGGNDAGHRVIGEDELEHRLRPA